MKTIFRLSVIIFLLCFCLPCYKLNANADLSFPETEPKISMDFQDANLKDILKVLSIQSGLNFIASEALQDRKITLYLDQVPLDKTMDRLFKANNLSYELDKDSNIFIVKDWGRLAIETVTKVFYLKYATVSTSSMKEEMASLIKGFESSFSTGGGVGGSGGSSTGGEEGKWKKEENSGITTVIKKLLSENGSIIEDFRTNSLVVTDTPIRMAVITKIIASLDVSVPQVLLEVEMLDVSKNVVDRLGFDFGTTPLTAVLTGAAASAGFPFGSWTRFFDASNGSIAINTGTNTYSVALDWLRTQTDTKFLARPKILTLNNETAEIRIATNESIGVKTTTEASTGTTSAEPERTETGVILRVTPQVNLETGEITMFVYPKVAEAIAGNDLTLGSATYQYRDPEERSTKTLVRVKDGQTVVLGGLIRNELLNTETKLPILGDLPLIGRFFRHKGGTSDKNKQRELLVFITPHIIKDTDMMLAQTKTAKLPEREQNTVSAINREAIINTSLNAFDKKKK